MGNLWGNPCGWMIFKIISFVILCQTWSVSCHRSSGYQSSMFRLSTNNSSVSQYLDSISGCAALCLTLGKFFFTFSLKTFIAPKKLITYSPIKNPRFQVLTFPCHWRLLSLLNKASVRLRTWMQNYEWWKLRSVQSRGFLLAAVGKENPWKLAEICSQRVPTTTTTGLSDSLEKVDLS